MTYTKPHEQGCCIASYAGFFGQVETLGVQPDKNALGLIKTCQRVYLEISALSSFCFDDLNTLNEFACFYKTIPVRHLQVVLYTSRMLYYEHPDILISRAEHDNWQKKLNGSWERKLQEVSEACSRIPGLKTLLLSVHPDPVFADLVNKKAVLESLKAVTAVPTAYAEILSKRAGGGPILLRFDGDEVELDCLD
ncbi:hypothetical protein OQA88_2504 [Cercophora sp. LCS_1]